MIAHLLPSNVIPDTAQWGAIGLVAVGGLGVLRRRHRILDLLSWAAFAAGALACMGMVGVAMVAPPAPVYSLSLAVGNSPASPVQMTVCARNPDGSAATAPGGDRVLAVVVDGVQVATETGSRFAVALPQGTHTVRVEVLTRDHREFNPAIAVDAKLTVTGSGPSATWKSC